MSYQTRLQDDVKSAMRAGDAETRDTLRLLLAALKNKKIELGRELAEADELQVLQKQRKSREDSVAQYEAAGRSELAAKERAEIAVIDRYLPQGLSEQELVAAVRAAIAETGAATKADLGKVIKAVLAAHQGRVDGRRVQTAAAGLLP